VLLTRQWAAWADTQFLDDVRWYEVKVVALFLDTPFIFL
jgi:hypothetical protein